MVIDRRGAPEGSLQFCWLHSCWWSYWWKQRNSCLCGHCWHQPHLHPVLWLLCSQMTEKNPDTRENYVRSLSTRSLSQICHNTLDYLSVSAYLVSPALRWAEAAGSTLCPLPCASLSPRASWQSHSMHATLEGLSPALSFSSVLYVFITYMNTIWQIKEGLFC